MSAYTPGSSIPAQQPVTFRSVTPTQLGVEYWDRTAQGELPLRRCRACGVARMYLTDLCASCHSQDWEWIAASGNGTVYASTVIRYRMTPEFPETYVLGLVDLDEGPRVMTTIVGLDEPAVVPIGTHVHVAFDELPSGQRLPVFTVAIS